MTHPLRYLALWLVLLAAFAAAGALAAAPPPSGWAPAPLPIGARPLPGPLFAAGDGEITWLLRPAMAAGSDSERAFSVIAHDTNSRDANSDLWQGFSGALDLFQPLPQCVAISDPTETLINARHRLFVFFPAGQVWSFEAGEARHAPEASLPADELPVAAAGMPDGIYLITRGPDLPPPATAPANSAATGPASTAPATDPATTRKAPDVWTLWRYDTHIWHSVAVLGTVAAPGQPTSEATVRLARSYDHLALLWAEPFTATDSPTTQSAGTTPSAGVLQYRMIGFHDGQADIGPIQAIPVPQSPHTFFATTLAPQAIVLWPEPPVEVNDPVILRGGSFTSAGTFASNLTLKLDKNSQRISVETDLAIAPLGNVLGVFFSDNVVNQLPAIHSQAFSRAGRALLSLAAAVVPVTASQQNAPLYSSLALAVIITLLAVSLWQYQSRPGGSAAIKKKKLHVARLNKRIIAAAIDGAIAVLIVLVASQLINGTSDQDALNTLQRWVEQWFNWETIFNSPDLLAALGLYTVSVTVGELINGRSLGKAMLHLKVVTLDGTPPTVAAILIRNVIRCFEIISGILLIFMLINENRQRLGDFFARTIVIDTNPPLIPPGRRPPRDSSDGK